MCKSKLHPLLLLVIASLQLFTARSSLLAQTAIPAVSDWRQLWYTPAPALADSTIYDAGLHLIKWYTKQGADSARTIGLEMARRDRQKGIAQWVATPKYYAGRRQYKLGNTEAAYASFVEACIVNMQMASNTEEIEAYAQKGLTITDSLDLKRSEVFLLINAGHLLADSLAVEPATYYLRRCMKSAKSMGYKEFEYVAKLYLAKVQHAQAAYTRSLALCREIRPFFDARNDAERLLILNEVYSSNFEALGQPDSAYYYLKQKEAADHALHNRALIKRTVSQYWAYKTAQEKKMLTLQKQHAEQQAQQARSQARSSSIIVGLVVLLLLFIIAVFYLRYNQKQRYTEDLKALNQSLIKEREKLSRINSRLNRFSSIVSHDILANLDLILTTGNVMAGSASSGTNLPRYYEMTQHTARELKSYCLKLLHEAKNGNARPQMLTPPTPILEKVLARYETRLLQAGYEVKTTPLSAAPLSETQIEQLFQNLVSNALRHAADVEHPKLFIAEKQDKNGRYWITEDNGPGLTDEIKRAAFEPETSTRSNGVGQQIGLSLLHACLAESGVALTVEDADMGGARFIIRF